MKCPKCTTETLAVTSTQGIDVDRCSACGGIWFDEQELPRLLRVTRQELSSLRGGTTQDDLNTKRGVCPRDTIPLLRVCSAQNPAVVVDACTQCRGIWLDGGEFDRLLS
jgi:uncharacterized protein